MKKCRFCAEEIQDEAIKCKHCGEFLNKNKKLNCFLGCLIGLLAFILLTNVFIYLVFAFFKVMLYKMSSFGGQMPHLYSPFNAHDIQHMLTELGQGWNIFWENLTGDSLQSYQRIYPPQ